MWEGKCVDKCANNLVHAPPDGKCQAPAPTTPNPVQLQTLTPAALCAAQSDKEMWEGMCVDKCRGNQVHSDPDGKCVPPPRNSNRPGGNNN
jgi:hypothetical protein